MLTFLYGTRSARAEIYKNIAADVAEGRRAYLIVPDQKALLAEEALMRTLPRSAALLADAVGFSRLANLVCRRYGSLTYRYATEGAKVVTMYRALGKLRPHLSVFGGELRKGTLEALCSLMREFRTCSVTADELTTAAESLGNTPLANKLRDLALLYTEYEARLHERFAEQEDDLDTLAELLAAYDFFEDAHVYIDSFISFTKQEMTVLSRMLSRGVHVTVALPFSRRGAHMAECADTRKKLLALCARLSVGMQERYIESDAPAALRFAKDNLWDFAASDRFDAPTADVLTVVHCADKNEEVRHCIHEIRRALYEGHSYADIAVIARNAESYTGTLDRMLERCGIPFFFSKKTDAALLPLTGLILSALSLYIGDFKESDVAAYIKTGLVGLTDDECDLFEEYIDRWNIHGRARYLDGEGFTMSGVGYTAEETDPETLREINAVKEKVAAPLARLCDSLDGAHTVKEFATAVFVYLEELGIREKSLEPTLVRYFGVDKTAEAIRLWNLTMEAFDTLVDAASDEETTASDFHALVRLLFSAIDIASIPTSKDQIIIGNADTIRIDERKIVILLGAVEGAFPAPVSESPTLPEHERSILDGVGITLSQNLRLRSARELYHFVRAIDFATERVIISCYAADADGRTCAPSFAIARLKKLFPNLLTYNYAAFLPLGNYHIPALAADLVGSSTDASIEAALKATLFPRGLYTPPLTDASALSNSTAALAAETAAALYGDTMRLSQSKIDTYVDCKLRHFMQYILTLEDTAPFEFNPANTGTFVHSILENFLKTAMESGKRIADYTEEEIDLAAKSLCAAETEKILRSGGGGSARMLCFFERMYRNIRLVLTNLVREFQNSRFEPFLLEYKIGLGGHKPLAVTLPDGASVSLNGIADRVDIYKEDDKVYLRVADYKTGKKPFSESDLAKGKNLQLLIYLFSLCEVADKKFFDLVGVDSTESILPAGATYFVVKAPRISLDSAPEGDATAAESMLERKGFVFSAETLADAIDRSADKQFSKKLTPKDEADTAALYETVKQSIADVAAEMRAGRIDTADTACGAAAPCRYCAYARICRRDMTRGEEDDG